MKAVFVIALVVCFLGMIAACDYNNGNGEPVCTQANVNTGSFPNNWDSTAYWVCSKVGQAAEAKRCDQQGYSTEKKACVDWSEWTWTTRCDPPTA